MVAISRGWGGHILQKFDIKHLEEFPPAWGEPGGVGDGSPRFLQNSSPRRRTDPPSGNGNHPPDVLC